MIPASQRARFNAADMVNELRKQGAEIHTANAAFKAGNVQVEAGDWIIRGDQPYRTLVDMYTAMQNYSPANPRPYDDTGWTMQLMRNVQFKTIADKAMLDQPMTLMTANAKPAGGIDRHRQPYAGHRSHDRQLAGDVPLQARRREDGRGRGGLRGGRPQVPRRRVHHRQRRSRGARADARRSSA